MPNAPSKRSAERLFSQYKDPNAVVGGDPIIGPEGLEGLCSDLGIDPAADIDMLLFAWRLKAQTPCQFTKSEFVSGVLSMGVDSVAKLREALVTVRAALDDPAAFRDFYAYAYDYNRDPDQKSMSLDIAKDLWRLLLRDRFMHLDLWLEFLESKTHSIPRDTYMLLLEFARSTAPDLSDYDENGAWPVLIDEFVDFAKKRFSEA